MLVAVAASMMFTGAAAQSQQSYVGQAGMTPASPFYFLEQVSEGMALAVARAPVIGSQELEAKVRANQASERLAEARKLAETNRPELVERTMRSYSRQMERSVQLASNSENQKLRRRLGKASSGQEQVLQEVEQRVPAEAREGIRKAIESNRQGRRQLEVSRANAAEASRKPGGTGENGGADGEMVPGSRGENRGSDELQSDSGSNQLQRETGRAQDRTGQSPDREASETETGEGITGKATDAGSPRAPGKGVEAP